ncbi:hypothetical protein PHLGIDRAFT_18495 [Phlebiopsis gigantea 11061_1 CR5-6]|uniref:Uncharacterized protein n=1 Tax=Phlebiopsis gigantea (strain 11061_1 CR5-6) TaxID=745531 RepID=A0A0C3SB93_PHLG1|nr:hypothetical protein PHLGIDRAFT_18495 [Phlebiopsis gigantea 11061_1 CR5-6]
MGQLSEDSGFVKTIKNLKEEQIQLEKRLWDERRAIEKRHEEKVQVARTKANMIGVALSKFEADNMTDAFRRELQHFDKERVLPAWDGLVSRQQTALERLGVPTMFSTVVPVERQKQHKVMQVLAEVITE